MSFQRIHRTFVACVALLLVTMAAAVAAAQQACCRGSGCCGPFGDPCVLQYGAAGSVSDAVTGLPIVAARIQVLDLEPVWSDADGNFTTSGSRAERCNIDYHYSITISAPGYQSYSSYLYTSVPFPTLDVALQPLDEEPTFSVSGIVAEFPPCNGLMRGVTVVLEPLGLSMETSVDGGAFSFAGVPPGDYVLSVGGCNPFGCWREEHARVVDEDLQISICMDERDPTPSSPVFTPTPSLPSVTPTSTATASFAPTNCAQPTVPLCRVGEQPRCGFDPCVAGCDCAPCDPCPDGEVYAGEVNSCACVACPVATPCPSGQEQRPCDAPCGLGCGCEITSDDPDEPATDSTGSGDGCAVSEAHTASSSLSLLWALGIPAVRRRMRRSAGAFPRRPDPTFVRFAPTSPLTGSPPTSVAAAVPQSP